MATTPTALFIFNRPRQTARSIASLREARPARLFVIADGPRNSADASLCAETRACLDAIDWPCEIQRLFAPANLGIKRRFVTGLAWLFEQVEEAMILEDDCRADPSFFPFAGKLLERYREDSRISMISGTNPMGCRESGGPSYHFSAFGSHWGWATWRRAWLLYDPEMTSWPRPETRHQLTALIPDTEARDSCIRLLDRVHAGSIDAWDCQWTLGQMLARKLAVVPAVNLVSNEGFSGEASHTRAPLAFGANLARHRMRFPLIAPETVEADRNWDARYLRWRYGRPDANCVLDAANRLVEESRVARALLLVEAALRTGVAQSDGERDLLLAHRQRTLRHLRDSADV